MNRKEIFAWILTASMTFQLAGCSLSENFSSESSESEDSAVQTEEIPVTEAALTETNVNTDTDSETSDVNYSEKDLRYEWDSNCTVITASDSGFDVNGDGAVSDGKTLTVSSEGTYYISGKISDGNIVVDSQDKKAVRLVMGGLDISCSYDVPVNVKAADKLIITLENEKVNSVTGSVSSVEDAPTGVIFSKSDLTVNGGGKLNVSSSGGDGIVSRDKLKLVSGEINITSDDDGIVGRDFLAVRDGQIRIVSKGDGIKSTNAEKGSIIIDGGNIDISSENDGIQSESTLTVNDGTLRILAGGGSDNGKEHHDDMMSGRGGAGRNQMPDDESADSDTVSMKGLKSKSDLIVKGGIISVNSADDAFHADTVLDISNGNITVMSGDDGLHSDGEINVSGGSIAVEKSYEGVEAAAINVNGGKIHVSSEDDGFNASSSERSTEPLLSIGGGYVYVDAAGDGLDSNGNINMTGGTVLVNGPVNNNNGPLDCGDNNNEITVSGGVLIAAGSSGMFETPSEKSSQNSVASTMINAEADTLCTLADESGNVIAAFRILKNAQAVVISSPAIKTGSVYRLCTGGTYSGELSEDGYASGGTVKDGTEITLFEVSSALTVHGNIMKGGFGGFGGERKQFGNGEIPEGGFGQRPDWNGEEPPQIPEGEFRHGMKGQRPDTDGNFDPADIPEGFEPPEGFERGDRKFPENNQQQNF